MDWPIMEDSQDRQSCTTAAWIGRISSSSAWHVRLPSTPQTKDRSLSPLPPGDTPPFETAFTWRLGVTSHSPNHSDPRQELPPPALSLSLILPCLFFKRQLGALAHSHSPLACITLYTLTNFCGHFLQLANINYDICGLLTLTLMIQVIYSLKHWYPLIKLHDATTQRHNLNITCHDYITNNILRKSLNWTELNSNIHGRNTRYGSNIHQTISNMSLYQRGSYHMGLKVFRNVSTYYIKDLSCTVKDFKHLLKIFLIQILFIFQYNNT